MRRTIYLSGLAVLITSAVRAQNVDTIRVAYSAARCPRCADWKTEHAPVKIYGNTYWVGTAELGAILITSPQGHVLIDGAIAQAAPLILDNIRALGFRVEDVKLILNSHDHYDHAGGLAALARATGARVVASPLSARVLERGESDNADPQFGLALPYPPVHVSETVSDGQTLRVGTLALTAHATGGHTPGGTTWSWRSCDGDVCRDIVYADSQSPASADDFYFTKSATYPNGVRDFERGEKVLEHLSCDILITPHPEASNFWERIASRDAGNANALVDHGACKKLAETARAALQQRLADEKKHSGG